MKVAITGHRAEEFSYEETTRTLAWISSMGTWYKDRGMTLAISGMASGADLWWSGRANHLDVPVHAYVPFWRHSVRFDNKWREFWVQQIGLAHEVTILGPSEPYDKTLFFKRNDAMIEACDEMMVVLKASKKSGGTFHCFKNLRASGKQWYWYDPETNIVKSGRGHLEDK